MKEHGTKPLVSVIDHLVLISPNLEEGIAFVEGMCGVRAALGGRHAIWRTRNALLGLGPRSYLEIMAPDEAADDVRIPRPFGLDALEEPRLVTWVARSHRLEQVVATMRRHGVDLGEIREGSRQRPDGTLLQWRMTDLRADREGGTVPYFIDWGSSPHPSASAPAGCMLKELRVFHPDAGRISGILRAAGIDAAVEPGPPGIRAAIQAAGSLVTLK